MVTIPKNMTSNKDENNNTDADTTKCYKTNLLIVCILFIKLKLITLDLAIPSS